MYNMIARQVFNLIAVGLGICCVECQHDSAGELSYWTNKESASLPPPPISHRDVMELITQARDLCDSPNCKPNDVISSKTGQLSICDDGTNLAGGEYPCKNVDMYAFVSLSDLGSPTKEGSDVWGWEDSDTGRLYALTCQSDGSSYVDITDPLNPLTLVFVHSRIDEDKIWRDIKTYEYFAFIVGDASEGHGLQVFDLRRLRDLHVNYTGIQTMTEDAWYPIKNCHNLFIHQDTGYLYCGGSNTCTTKSFLIYDVTDPLNAINLGCWDDPRYVHDIQCVTYHGPDQSHVGSEICFSFTEDSITISNVNNKTDIVLISRTFYAGSAYAHQGWLTEDHRYLLSDDELDENNGVNDGHAATFVWNVMDLSAPVLMNAYRSGVTSIDHNLYIRGSLCYQANYASGLRILDVSKISEGSLKEIGYFDVRPGPDGISWWGSWSVYAFYSRPDVIVVMTIERGLFVLRPRMVFEGSKLSGHIRNSYYTGNFVKFYYSSFDECGLGCSYSTTCTHVSYRTSSDECRLFDSVDGITHSLQWERDEDPLIDISAAVSIHFPSAGYYVGTFVSIDATSFQACAEECNHRGTCAHVSFRSSDQQCRIYDSATTMMETARWESDAALCASYDGYFSGRYDEIVTPAYSLCCLKCKLSNMCVHISYRGSDGLCRIFTSTTKFTSTWVWKSDYGSCEHSEPVIYIGAYESHILSGYDQCCLECNLKENCHHISYNDGTSECRLFDQPNGFAQDDAWKSDFMNRDSSPGFYTGQFETLQANSFDDCCFHCNVVGQCAHVSFRKGTSIPRDCRIYKSIDGFHHSNWWEKDALPCSSTLGYYVGQFTRTVTNTFDECCLACDVSPDCIHMSYRQSSSQCRLFGSTSTFNVHSRWASDSPPSDFVISSSGGSSELPNVDSDGSAAGDLRFAVNGASGIAQADAEDTSTGKGSVNSEVNELSATGTSSVGKLHIDTDGTTQSGDVSEM